MPGYKTHDLIGAASIVPISIIAIHYSLPLSTIVVLDIGIIFGTYFLSPDLDLNSRIYHRWGLLRWLWFPYQHLIHHRSWLSHSGPISATIRIVYLLTWFSPLLYLFGIQPQDLHYTLYYGILWIAFIIADTLHVLADLLVKEHHV